MSELVNLAPGERIGDWKKGFKFIAHLFLLRILFVLFLRAQLFSHFFIDVAEFQRVLQWKLVAVRINNNDLNFYCDKECFSLKIESLYGFFMMIYVLYWSKYFFFYFIKVRKIFYSRFDHLSFKYTFTWGNRLYHVKNQFRFWNQWITSFHYDVHFKRP